MIGLNTDTLSSNSTYVEDKSMIYADYNGSAPMLKEVKDYLIKRLESGPFANPNAVHKLGTKTLMEMENARATCAKVLGAKSKQVIFNSGATEGISTVFHSCLCNQSEKKIIITSGQEHSATLNTARWYADECGHELKILPSLENGLVDINQLREWVNAYRDQIGLVAIMAANNETGVIQPFHFIAELCKKNNIPYLCDTTQFIGKDHFHFGESEIDFAVTSGHKFGAMTGTGILLAKEPSKLKPFILGGGQEKKLRGGTQNYIGNELMAVALKFFDQHKDLLTPLKRKRMEFENRLKEKYPEICIIGESAERLATTTYLSYPGIIGHELQEELEKRDVFVTTSSACSDGKSELSRVLQSLGVCSDVGRGVVRISLGMTSPLEYYDLIFKALEESLKEIMNRKSLRTKTL